MPDKLDNLIRSAREIAERAYVPASEFKVGAAVLGGDGSIHVGCNVENASYGLTICAERAAVTAAVAAGVHRIEAVAVYTALDRPAPPCGACRQVLAEFGPQMTVHLVGLDGARVDTSLDLLLPDPFTFATFRRADEPSR